MPRERPRFVYRKDCNSVVDGTTGQPVPPLSEAEFKPIVEFCQIVDHKFTTFQILQTPAGLRWRRKRHGHPTPS